MPKITTVPRWIVPYPELHMYGERVFCVACSKIITSERKFQVDQHIKTASHAAKLSRMESTKTDQQTLLQCLPSTSRKSDQEEFNEDSCRIKKHTAPASQLETSDIEIKAESVSEAYCDQSFIVESPARSDDSLQEPWTSVTASTGAVVNTSAFDCSAPKRKRNESDVSRMISSISCDIRSLVDRSVNSSDAHFYQSVAFEVEKLDEDGKDLVKAAVWQIIYKVKSAKKRNVDLCLEDIFK